MNSRLKPGSMRDAKTKKIVKNIPKSKFVKRSKSVPGK